MDTNPMCAACARIEAPADDRELVRRIAEPLRDADAWITWFGHWFDRRFLNTRLLHAQQPPLPKVFHIDLWKTAHDNLKLSSNRLKNVQGFLGLPAEKTDLKQQMWQDARQGGKKGLRYVIEHCRQDVNVLELAYQRLKPYISGGLNLRLFGAARDACPSCGGQRIRSKGWYCTAERRYRRFECRTCGKSFAARKAEPR